MEYEDHYEDHTIWSEESGALLDRNHKKYLATLERQQNENHPNHLSRDPGEQTTPGVRREENPRPSDFDQLKGSDAPAGRSS